MEALSDTGEQHSGLYPCKAEKELEIYQSSLSQSFYIKTRNILHPAVFQLKLVIACLLG